MSGVAEVNALVLLAAIAIPDGYQQAPVYEIVSESVFKRVGTYIYKPSIDGYTVVFCIARTPVKLSCAVTGPGDLMVIIDTEATEHRS